MRQAGEYTDLKQRQQFLTFATHCAEKDAIYQHRMAELQQGRESIQQELLTIWRRRRSLEILQQREADERKARRERHEQDDILDGAVRAWYLRDTSHEMDSPHDLVVSMDSEVVS